MVETKYQNGMTMRTKCLIALFALTLIVAIGWFCGLFETADKAISAKESLTRRNTTVPVFSVQGGFYPEAFDLELTAPEGMSIYYTLDGSNPDTSSFRYEKPIHVYDRSAEPNVYRSISHVIENYHEEWVEPETVDKCFVVRAITADDKGNLSDSVTMSYFIGLDKYKDYTVVSIVADPDGLFGENGIYVTGSAYDEWYENNGKGLAPIPNYYRRGDKWEREASVEVLQEGVPVVNQRIGLRIQGAGSRMFALKRLSLIPRIEYGSITLSGIGTEDSKFNWKRASTRDGLLDYIGQEVGKDRDVLTVNAYPARIFLNGECWCNSYSYWRFSEQPNENYIAKMYGVTEDNVNVVDLAYYARGDLFAGENPYYKIYDYINRHDLSIPENYRAFIKIIDVQSYIDMMSIRIYMADCDFEEDINGIMWNTKKLENDEFGDTRWRWGLYDMDLQWESVIKEFESQQDWEIDRFTMIPNHIPLRQPINQWPMYTALRANDEFCKQFVLTFMDLVNTNFRMENINSILEKSLASGAEVEKARTFFENRPPYAMKYLAREFELTGEAQEVTLTTNLPIGGAIKLNTITPTLQNNRWTGLYFVDYPVTVTAIANEGYRFVGWEIDGISYSEETIEVAVKQGGTVIHAMFEAIA